MQVANNVKTHALRLAIFFS